MMHRYRPLPARHTTCCSHKEVSPMARVLILCTLVLTLASSRTTIIESPTLKAARLFYKSRIKPESLAVAYRTSLEANGWRHISSTTSAGKGTTQVYEKQDSSLQVLIYEGWYYTWTEVSTTRIIARPAPATR